MSLYVSVADVWPLNPKGEILLGAKIEDKHGLAACEEILKQPGLGFTEGGGGDMQMSLEGLAHYANTGPPRPGNGEQHFAPEIQAAQTRVLNAAKANHVHFLHAATPATIKSWIGRGATIIETRNRETARIGRAYTKRTMPA